MDYDTIYKRIQDGFYKTTLPYPENKLPIRPVLSKNSKYFQATNDEYNSSLEKYKLDQKIYREVVARNEKRFQEDVILMLISSGLTQEQANKAYNRAWDNGHYAGFPEVLECAHNLIDLF